MIPVLQPRIEQYINTLVDRMYIDQEIDRILDANFFKGDPRYQ